VPGSSETWLRPAALSHTPVGLVGQQPLAPGPAGIAVLAQRIALEPGRRSAAWSSRGAAPGTHAVVARQRHQLERLDQGSGNALPCSSEAASSSAPQW